MIKNIIFDMGDVLLKGHSYSVLNNLSISNKDYEILKTKFFSDFELLDLGKMTIKEKLNVSSIPNELKDKYGDILINYYKYRALNNELLDFIYDLKKNNYNIYILSDNNKEAITYFKSLDKFKYIDGWVVSYEFGFIKEDIKLFKILLDKYNLDPSECLFIDDKKNNIDIAKKLGINSIRYSFLNDDFNALIDKIKEILDK